jgi:hypothetical protein
MKKYNVTSVKKYMKGAEEKKIWLTVGTITEFDNGNSILELNMFPNQQFSIFENKPKGHLDDYADEIPRESEINHDELPF